MGTAPLAMVFTAMTDAGRRRRRRHSRSPTVSEFGDVDPVGEIATAVVRVDGDRGVAEAIVRAAEPAAVPSTNTYRVTFWGDSEWNRSPRSTGCA